MDKLRDRLSEPASAAAKETGPCTVFYSWQNDLPPDMYRYFIHDALQDAVTKLNQDITVSEDPRMDQVTQSLHGSTRIEHAIFRKIKRASAFVADISIVTMCEDDGIPNPNVMLELGYAIQVLGWDKIIQVFNVASGKPKDLPFDIRNHLFVRYRATTDTPDLAHVQAQLRGLLQSNLRLMLEAQAG